MSRNLVSVVLFLLLLTNYSYGEINSSLTCGGYTSCLDRFSTVPGIDVSVVRHTIGESLK